MTHLEQLVYAAWVMYVLAFAVNHLRVRRECRGRDRDRGARGLRHSDLGMLLQLLGAAGCFVFRADPARTAPVLAVSASVLSLASVALTWYALRHLGRQWRLQAVVAEDHELITSGPYRHLRHPTYTALLGLLVATALVLTEAWAAAGAILLFLGGTEIRVRAEDKLLAAHFPDEFPAYQQRVAAYFPPLR
jgi:protein-S-isoprenylcysteine O-methyltransferase Ste14